MANVKLTAGDVRRIRRLRADKNMSYTKLANLFGVSKSAINHIINQRNWKDTP